MSSYEAHVREAFSLIAGEGSPVLGWEMLDSVPLADPETAQLFLKGLKARNWRVTAACLQQVGRWANYGELFMPSLHALLDHPEETVRLETIKVLGVFGAQAGAAVEKLLAGLPASFAINEATLFTLASIPEGEGACCKILLQYLEAAAAGEAWTTRYLVRPRSPETGVGRPQQARKLEQAVLILSTLRSQKAAILPRLDGWFAERRWGQDSTVPPAELVQLYVALGCPTGQEPLIEFLTRHAMVHKEYVRRTASQLLFLHPRCWTREQRDRLLELADDESGWNEQSQDF